MTGFQHTSSFIFPTLAWQSPSEPVLKTNQPRMAIRATAMSWQNMSTDGAMSELISADNFTGPPQDFKLNHVNEILGLMGSTGEQLALAWTAEQDVQRWLQTATTRDPVHQRMGVRAMAERPLQPRCRAQPR
ncbi:hypothetical protein [Amycolatopsis sp. CA-230715]|uniref:hypothetical protein n=1 Tax=Amycolatopsis sp. CA-230715 TaxID=2745196 RepID=UPI001C00B5D0|nr:hypothetical protein [Amycolatopsis sp. CA-230715]QWF80992.1 hypothetical protein HUW46_04417 [Amycolatopsis sp. CA-230715]